MATLHGGEGEGMGISGGPQSVRDEGMGHLFAWPKVPTPRLRLSGMEMPDF